MTDLRAAVYQRILTDNLVGINLEENDSTRLHDEKLGVVPREGSSVITHGRVVVEPTETSGSRDEKILAIANVFSMLYEKERFNLPELPLWWSWKEGEVEMRIAFDRLQRWARGSRPMDVIGLMRYAMVSYFTLADGGGQAKEEVLFDWKYGPVVPEQKLGLLQEVFKTLGTSGADFSADGGAI